MKHAGRSICLERICDESGLMSHAERASLPAHDSQDGLKIFQNLAKWLKQ